MIMNILLLISTTALLEFTLLEIPTIVGYGVMGLDLYYLYRLFAWQVK